MEYPESSQMIEQVRERMRHHLGTTEGGDTTGVELVGLVHLVARTYDMITMQKEGAAEGAALSRARWGVLMHLWREEKHGKTGGLTPTYLSQCQHVGKNTVSALLRGLEEQGLVQRELDPIDHRIFRIQLSPAGRKMIANGAPHWESYMNRLASGLNEGERTQLCDLLAKLYSSLISESEIQAGDVEPA